MGFKTGKHGKVYNNDKKSHGSSKGSPGNNDGSNESVRDYFNSLSSYEQFNIESNAGVEQEDQLYNGEDKHDFDDNLESTQKKLEIYYSKWPKATIEKATKQDYPGSVTTEDLEDVFGKNILMYVDEDDHGMDGNEHQKIIEDPRERMKFAKEFAKKHDAQIYTYVDLDSGETGYSQGPRIVNAINQGEYVIVRMPGLMVDNS